MDQALALFVTLIVLSIFVLIAGQLCWIPIGVTTCCEENQRVDEKKKCVCIESDQEIKKGETKCSCKDKGRAIVNGKCLNVPSKCQLKDHKTDAGNGECRCVEGFVYFQKDDICIEDTCQPHGQLQCTPGEDKTSCKCTCNEPFVVSQDNKTCICNDPVNKCPSTCFDLFNGKLTCRDKQTDCTSKFYSGPGSCDSEEEQKKAYEKICLLDKAGIPECKSCNKQTTGVFENYCTSPCPPNSVKDDILKCKCPNNFQMTESGCRPNV